MRFTEVELACFATRLETEIGFRTDPRYIGGVGVC